MNLIQRLIHDVRRLFPAPKYRTNEELHEEILNRIMDVVTIRKIYITPEEMDRRREVAISYTF